jgi:diaminopimelate decarboxylase
MPRLPGLNLIGFHIYSGTNSLDADAIAENFGIFIDIFKRASGLSGCSPRKLIFGSGFGIPYLPGEATLDIEAVAAKVNPMLDELRATEPFTRTDFALELGRWIAGPAGWLLSSVISTKTSRGVEFRNCDAGFNNHLAACGMMGSVIRRNWIIDNISNPAGPVGKYNLVGPLCTTIDLIATNVELPRLEAGDIIAISQSGAYGLTASPTRFISHPEPLEVMMSQQGFTDITESRLNHWSAGGRQ